MSSIRNIVFVAFPGMKLLDLTGPMQVFCDARLVEEETIPYQVTVCSSAGGAVKTDTPVAVPSVAIRDLPDQRIHTLIICGGGIAKQQALDADFIAEIKKLARNSTRVGSICTGAFILAQAGLLEGRRAVTHWDSCTQLADSYQETVVEPDAIYVEDGPIWTSAGVTAGIDMALAMVGRDLGRPAAMMLARILVSYMVRPGGQSQFSAALDQQIRDAEGRFEGLHNWIRQDLQRPLKVPDLAAFMKMSPRSFARSYQSETGVTPAKGVEILRLEKARQLLEQTDKAVTIVAVESGFGDDERMRRAFFRHLMIAPVDYRSRHRPTSG